MAGFPARHPGHIYVWTEHLLEAEPPDGPLHRLGLDKLADLPRLLPGGGRPDRLLSSGCGPAAFGRHFGPPNGDHAPPGNVFD